MADCRDWTAVFGRRADGSGLLRVSGLCIFPTAGYLVELRRHDAQAAEDELLLELNIEKPTGPVLQVVTGMPVAYEEVTELRYARVSILPEGPFGLPVADARNDAAAT